jgi:predicted nuclease of predicted toxin-antitoxin system
VRFLIDECLTVELAREAERAGYEAHPVVHLGKASWKDWTIRDYAVKHGFILVTNNASDFRKLYTASDMHPGPVILVPNVVQEKQVLLFHEAMKRLVEFGDALHKVLEVDIVEEDITLTMYNYPAAKRNR